MARHVKKKLTIGQVMWIVVIVNVFFWLAGLPVNSLNGSICSNCLNFEVAKFTQSRDSELRAWGSLEIIEEF